MNINEHAPLDLHPGNVVFANVPKSQESEAEILQPLGQLRVSDVKATLGNSLTLHVPKYIVLPASFPSSAQHLGDCQVKIVDFGEAFMHGQPRQIRCPLVFRAPETIFSSKWDMQADIWSLACTV